jgi:pimeloyl-ACP methyl ester carboxylesterase
VTEAFVRLVMSGSARRKKTVMHPRPPCRSTHTFSAAGSRIVYDRWSNGPGRPVLLLHALLFDRTQWWPLAADLADHCTVVAPDLPGHGETPMPGGLSPAQVAGDLARLVDSLDLRRAPLVVGHATAAPLANAFAEHFAVHGLLIADEPVDTPGSGVDSGAESGMGFGAASGAESGAGLGAGSGAGFGVDEVVAASGLERVPEQFRSFAEPRRDPGLVAAYRSWLDRPSSRRPVLPHARRPSDDLTRPRFTPLSDTEGLAARIKYLL